MHRRYVGGLKENFSSVFKKKKEEKTQSDADNEPVLLT